MDTHVLDVDDEFSEAPPPGREVPKRLISIVLATLLALGAGGYLFFRFTGKAEAQVFQYSFTKGEKTSYELSMNMTVTPKGEGVPAPVSMKMSATMDFEVVDKLSDASSVVDVRLRNVFVEPQGAALPEDLGALRLTISPSGQVTKTEGTGVMSILGVDPAASFTPGAGASDSASSQWWFPAYPSEAIGPGDSWSETSTYPMPFGDDKLTITVKGSHEGFEELSFGRMARIHQRMDLPMDVEFSFADLFNAISRMAQEFGSAETPPSLPPAMVDAKMVMTGAMTMEADSYVDPETAEFVQMDGSGTMNMRVEVQGLPQEALAGKPSAMDMEAKFDMSVVRASSAKPA